jgi:branched-chain amino acid transport system substrate-binding protein
MKISRREVLVGGAASLAAVSACARGEQSEQVVIGALDPLSGASEVGGVDARHALETAVDVINTPMDLDSIPFLSAENSSPSRHRRGLKYFFRAAAHDEMFSKAMFDFFDVLRNKGTKIETLALIHEDTIFGTDSSNTQITLADERGYQITANIKYRANSPSLTAEVQQLKAANADVLMPSSYPTDSILLVKTMAELGYSPKAIVAQDSGFSESSFSDAVGDKVEGVITRSGFSLDLAEKRPSVGKVNEMFRARAGKDLNDLTSREFMGLLILADAIDRARSTDGEQIREALATTDLPGERTIMPWKQVKFDETGQNNDADPVLLQYVKGTFTVFPTHAATAEPIWPMIPPASRH